MVEHGTHVKRADFPRFIEEEKSYLRSLKSKSPSELVDVGYIERLLRLQEAT
jgi:hypothetical protein